MAGKFEVFQTKAGTWGLRLKTANGEVVATGWNGGADHPSAEYGSHTAARSGCDAIREAADGAPIVEVEK